ncbi:hypothetical protein MUP79_03195 [Candidatus Bathyarchaeota archaeon]|nr:hypothetical protein [Candidatus Bathyarchaeota archaeon]
MGKFPRKKVGFVVRNVDYDDDEMFDDEDRARDEGVEIDIEEVVRWECVDCGEVYEDKDDAYHCCE